MDLRHLISFGLNQLKRSSASLYEFVNTIHQNSAEIVLIKVGLPNQFALSAQLIIKKADIVVLGIRYRILLLNNVV